MLDVVLIAITFIASAAVTGAVKSYAEKGALLDVPNDRSSHDDPTPRGGGLAIVIAYFVLLVVLQWLGKSWGDLTIALIVGGGMVAAVGFLDDHRNVAISHRFAIHVVAATAALAILGGFPPIPIGTAAVDLGLIGHVLAVVFLVWLTNLFNFMDGIDGIAATEAMFVLIGATVIGFSGALGALDLVQLGLAAACAGFLCWNWPPARIFMGDVGSGFLGFVLGILAVGSISSDVLTVWTWLILAGAFFVDATVTLVVRAATGQTWYAAHRAHVYQRLARRFESHRASTVIFGLVNICWLLPIAWASEAWRGNGWWLTVVAWAPLAVYALATGAGRPDEQAKPEAA